MAEIKLDGLEDMLARLQTMGEKAAKVENKALRAGAKPLAEAMSRNVAVSDRNETHIRDDIKIGNVKTKDGEKSISVGPGKETNWRASFLEFGASQMEHAYPFMDPSLKESRDESLREMADVIKDGIGL
jgi:HK97 gp10 family phage protein